MSPSWIWSDKITNEVGYNHFISNMGECNDCFSKFSNRVLPPIFISTILQSGKVWNLAHYFPYDVKLRLLAHSRSFLANQKARNAIVGAENLLKIYIHKRETFHDVLFHVFQDIFLDNEMNPSLAFFLFSYGMERLAAFFRISPLMHQDWFLVMK